MITQYKVTGITCGHCVKAIKEEVGELAGVEQVELDEAGDLKLHSAAPVDFGALTAAVAEAGDAYAITPV
ncbi:MAG: cation transporter [Propionibacteriaceae bacterium]|jgi:copper chaperone CopZ|nr:cation transporter [Propionibacteriaceae bacterium]